MQSNMSAHHGGQSIDYIFRYNMIEIIQLGYRKSEL